MSENESIENIIEAWIEDALISMTEGKLLISELRTLRAHDEAWRAVRKARDEGSIGGPPISHWITNEVERQIARLDAMKEGK